VLVERSILPAAMREPLRAMARFRNRLVHLYWDVDDALVHRYLQECLPDIDKFAQCIAAHPW
jgi:uncharacterized protein YutE (UPF0331/DUF86 family)